MSDSIRELVVTIVINFIEPEYINFEVNLMVSTYL